MTEQQLNEMGFYRTGKIHFTHEAFPEMRIIIRDSFTMAQVIVLVHQIGVREGLMRGEKNAQSMMRIALGIDPPHSREDEY